MDFYPILGSEESFGGKINLSEKCSETGHWDAGEFGSLVIELYTPEA